MDSDVAADSNLQTHTDVTPVLKGLTKTVKRKTISFEKCRKKL